MPTVKNAAWGGVTVELSGGKMILLGPRESREITDDDFKAPDCQRKISQMKLYVLPDQGEGTRRPKARN